MHCVLRSTAWKRSNKVKENLQMQKNKVLIILVGNSKSVNI